MKVGIFGDSFAQVPEFKNTENQTLCWPEIIAQQYKTENYALSGSCLYYSVDKFKTYHANFDKIIFLVTSPDRFGFNDYVVDYCDKDFTLRKFKHAQNLATVESRLEELKTLPADPIIKQAMETAKNYYIYINDNRKNNYLQSLMLEDVKRTRPDTIFIPCFPHSWIGVASKTLSEIQQLENDHWGHNVMNSGNKTDIRYCHLTEENNRILANEVVKWINGEPVHLDLSKFKTPVDPISKYFI
jgi:hypothetical protein